MPAAARKQPNTEEKQAIHGAFPRTGKTSQPLAQKDRDAHWTIKYMKAKQEGCRSAGSLAFAFSAWPDPQMDSEAGALHVVYALLRANVAEGLWLQTD
jgi:hypothetical protein